MCMNHNYVVIWQSLKEDIIIWVREVTREDWLCLDTKVRNRFRYLPSELRISESDKLTNELHHLDICLFVLFKYESRFYVVRHHFGDHSFTEFCAHVSRRQQSRNSEAKYANKNPAMFQRCAAVLIIRSAGSVTVEWKASRSKTDLDVVGLICSCKIYLVLLINWKCWIGNRSSLMVLRETRVRLQNKVN